MGRKPKFWLAEKLQKHESTEMEPESNNPSLEKVDVQLESKNPTTEKVEPQQASSSRTSLREKAKKIPPKVRRSGRLRAVMASENRDAETQDIERILEEITIIESEKEDEPADEKMPDPTLNRKNLDEKLDYVVELLEAQQKTMDSLNYGAIGKTFFNEGSGMGDITYKSLYLDSQKKVQALTEENRQLNRKLEYALGKIEVVCFLISLIHYIFSFSCSFIHCFDNFSYKYAAYRESS
ncbi:hypothetical protein MANES_05G076300v8 [Manihot esculenta]|uniref:Uncharacterized protein n=2 Tax=Manihot esculenta TaxID=3983 RepID=A0ACB7HNL0_MANES|nr:hypothetical protein MANES_05G076300v8 [Manihot esculenta]